MQHGCASDYDTQLLAEQVASAAVARRATQGVAGFPTLEWVRLGRALADLRVFHREFFAQLLSESPSALAGDGSGDRWATPAVYKYRCNPV